MKVAIGLGTLALVLLTGVGYFVYENTQDEHATDAVLGRFVLQGRGYEITSGEINDWLRELRNDCGVSADDSRKIIVTFSDDGLCTSVRSA